MIDVFKQSISGFIDFLDWVFVFNFLEFYSLFNLHSLLPMFLLYSLFSYYLNFLPPDFIPLISLHLATIENTNIIMSTLCFKYFNHSVINTPTWRSVIYKWCIIICSDTYASCSLDTKNICSSKYIMCFFKYHESYPVFSSIWFFWRDIFYPWRYFCHIFLDSPRKKVTKFYFPWFHRV